MAAFKTSVMTRLERRAPTQFRISSRAMKYPGSFGSMTAEPANSTTGERPHLLRRLGLLPATALNMSNMVGVGPFITIPALIGAINGGGPQSMLGWVVGLMIAIPDGLVWAELGAAMPGSGGSYVYLREGFGKERWGRLMAFLFIWQFILSGPLEIGSGFIGFKEYLRYFMPGAAGGQLETRLQIITVGLGLVAIALLYRKIASIGKIAVGLWLGVLLTTGIVIFAGIGRFDPPSGFRSAASRFRFFDGLPVWPGRRRADRHLRLPRLLRRLLHRRRSEESGESHSPLDPAQPAPGGGDLHRHEPLDHGRRAVA